MLRLGIIGTNWITTQFVEAAIESGDYQLVGVYSREREKAEHFGKPYQATIFETDLEAFANHPGLDVVYIASPNSLHFEQAMMMMKAKKHVIVEKPLASNPTEWALAAHYAAENHVLMFEAARHLHEENFEIVKEQIKKLDVVVGATFTYMKYSSRYDQVLEGEEPNIFSPTFSGGALADLGIYSVYAAIGWFGKPQSSHYFAKKIVTGVDGMGTVILSYPNFNVTLLTGKIVQSYLPSEIYGLDHTIVLDGVNSISSIEVVDWKANQKSQLAVGPKKNPMIDEAKAFSEIINDPNSVENKKKYTEWLRISQEVTEVLRELRRTADIEFEADKIEG